MKKINWFLGLVLSLMMLGHLAAQPAKSYTVTHETGTYAPLGESAVTLPFFGGKDFQGRFFGQDKDGNPVSVVPTANQKIGTIPFFDFGFCGQKVNGFAVFSNGVLLLGQDSVMAASNLKTSSFFSTGESLHILNFPAAIKSGTSYSDAEVYASKTADETDATALRYEVTGSEGSRMLTVEFANLKVFLPNYKTLLSAANKPEGLVADDTVYNLSYQIKLYEADGRIDIVYAGSPSPRAYQTMMLTTGLRNSAVSTDKMALANTKGRGWEESLAVSTSTSGKTLELNDSVYPVAGFTVVFDGSDLASCQTPASDVQLTGIEATSTKSTEITLKATKPATADRTLVFFSESPVWKGGALEDGKDYAQNVIIGDAELISKTENTTSQLLISKQNLRPGKYYLHVFQCNYQCSGLMRYSAAPQTIDVKTLFGAPEVKDVEATETALTLQLEAYEGKNVLVAFSERAWDESLDGNSNGISLYKPQGMYQTGDTLNKNSVAIQGFPPMRVLYMGQAKDLKVSDLQPGTPYHFMLWSYETSAEDQCTYSTVCNQSGFTTATAAPVEFGFRSDAVSKTMQGNLSTADPLPLPAGWTRTLVDETEPTGHFVVSIGLGTPSDMKTDAKKRLEFYANGKSSNQIPLRQCTADIVSPAFALPQDGPYRLIYKMKWVSPSSIPNNNYVEDSPYALQAGDTLYVEYAPGNDAAAWRRIDTVTAGTLADGQAVDELGYGERSVRFEAEQNAEAHIRFVYTSNHKHKCCLYSLRVEPVAVCDLGYPLVWAQTATTAKSMQVRWESPAADGIAAYEVEYRKHSTAFMPNEWISAGITPQPGMAVYDLEPACGYEFRIKPLCDGIPENAVSVWSAASPVFYTRYGLPLTEDFDDNIASDFLSTQPVAKAWATYTGRLADDGCSEWEEKTNASWMVSRVNLTGDANNRAASVMANKTGGAWLLLPPLYVAEYPVDVNLQFDLSLVASVYVSGVGSTMYADSMLTGKRRLLVLMSGEDGCFTEADTVFRIDTAGGSHGYTFRNLLNTPVEIPLTAVSGNVRFALYWENFETVNTMVKGTFYLDNFVINYLNGAPCDSVFNLKIDARAATVADISWQGEAAGYTFYYGEAGADGAAAVMDSLYTDQTQVVLENLRPQTAYAVAVRSVCDREAGVVSLRSAGYGFTTPASVCTPPQNVYCNDSALNRLGLAFESEADRHEIRYGEETSEETASRLFDGRSVTLTNLKVATPYIVRLRSVCAPGDTSAYTEPLTFTTAAYPACPPVTGLKSEVLSQSDVNLTWDKNRQHLSYTLGYKVKEAADFTLVESIEEAGYLLQELSEGTPYVWQVKAVCAYGQESPYSETAGFEISPLGNLVPDALESLVVYSDRGDIVIANPDGLRLERIVLADLQGRVLLRKQALSDVSVRLAAPRVSGIVLMQVETSGGTRTYKLVMSNR